MKSRITITQCANGYIVDDDEDLHQAHDGSSALVFQSMQELIKFINENFTHRSEVLKSDVIYNIT